jgi:hypothetical protein
LFCAGNDESDQQTEQIEHLSIALAAGVFAVRQALLKLPYREKPISVVFVARHFPAIGRIEN